MNSLNIKLIFLLFLLIIPLFILFKGINKNIKDIKDIKDIDSSQHLILENTNYKLNNNDLNNIIKSKVIDKIKVQEDSCKNIEFNFNIAPEEMGYEINYLNNNIEFNNPITFNKKIKFNSDVNITDFEGIIIPINIAPEEMDYKIDVNKFIFM